MTNRPSRHIQRRPDSLAPLQLWGGIECTVNRVKDRYFDQIALSGHCDRPEDLERFASLGIGALRYPVLWERIAPDEVRHADWSSTDRALERLRELRIKPIIGLVHHGSGPRHTSLIDPAFAGKLREFSRAVAERYPWVEMVTPINEPLTTARFSGLYGLWYPHAKNDRTFVRALLNQIFAIRGSMEAFRAVNPRAQLIQTEDLGKTYSTPLLSYQAEFENERRWLTFDLLSGCVGGDHPLYEYLLRGGAREAELANLVARPCEPDVMGINHYLTGERFLDEHVDQYPQRVRGGNGIHGYVDVEAVRALENGIAGHAGLISEAWERFHVPVAVTEVHLGCTREQQMRWLNEAWQSALELRGEGCDIRAVTIWSLLGCHGWDYLLTKEKGSYEPGAFDARSPVPRETALAALARGLGRTGAYDHPALDGDGWWRTRERLTYKPYSIHQSTRAMERNIHPRRPILITGAKGTLGSAFARVCAARGLEHRALKRADLDITNPAAVAAVISELQPWAVINASGYVRVDDAEWDAETCRRVNTKGAVTLAHACAERGIRLMTFSTDLVFDGDWPEPYTEGAKVNPLNVYGESKANAEREMLALERQPLVIRTSAFFGPWDSYNFLATTLTSVASGIPVAVASDAVVSPTYVPDLVNNSLDLLIDDERGLWHLANVGAVTWAEFGKRAAAGAGLDPALVVPTPASALGLKALRPRYSVLASERGRLMPTLDHALSRYIAECAQNFATPAAAVNG